MNKIRLVILSLILIVPIGVNAAGSASISGSSSVDSGSNASVSVTLRNTAAWNISISSSNGCAKRFADVTSDGNNTTKTFTLSCKTTSIGNVTFTVTGDITSSNGEKSYVNLTKNVSVTKPRNKESESRLTSLSIEGYEIDFNSDKHEYSINVDENISKINISAKAISKYASIAGIGEINLSGEDEKIIVTSTSETGEKSEYIIDIFVTDENPIKINIDGKEYTVMKSNKFLSVPDKFVEDSININDINIPAYYNETSNIRVVGIKDNEGNIKYAIYEGGNYKLFNYTKSSLNLFISSKELKGYKKITININEIDYDAYRIDDRYSIVYAMNLDNGKYDYYVYDNLENTFQVFFNKKGNKSYISYIILSFIIVALVGYIIIDKKKLFSK